MKKYLWLNILLFCSAMTMAQDHHTDVFKGTIENATYRIFIKMNFIDNDITVPGQDVFGKLPGFLGDSIDSRTWLFTSATLKGNTATLYITNDYGSEDLVATLSYNQDNTFLLKQKEGSDLKIVRDRKWKKLPKEIIFIRKPTE